MNRKTSLARNKENIRPSLNKKYQKKHSLNFVKKPSLQSLPARRPLLSLRDPPVPTSNPQLVPHCQPQIFEYLASRAPSWKLPANFMDRQPDINARMRSILVDWLVDVNVKFRLLPQSLFQTVNLLDRFAAQVEVKRQHLQLVGVAALMIVGKFEEIYPPLLKDYVAVCDNAYSKEEILEMETKVLQLVDFDLAQTTSFGFLLLIQQRIQLEEKAFVFARFILENALMDLSSLQYSNLELAAGAVFLVNKIFKHRRWNQDFEEITKVSLKTAKQCAKHLFQVVQQIDEKAFTALKRKFSSPQFFEVSKYKIEKVKKQQLITFIQV